MNQLQIFQYQGHDVDFELIDGHVYANATAMCQPFAKRPVDWMRLPATIRYAEAIKAKCDNLTSLTISRKGGADGGGSTLIHEKLILKLAQWLDVDFEIWCDEQISRLLSQQTQVALPQTYKEALTELLSKVEENERLLAENEALKPIAQYAKNVLLSQSELLTTVIAKELGTSAVTLNRLLEKKGVQHKVGNTWVLNHRYQDKGYTRLRTHVHSSTSGSMRTEHHLVWTEKGREFIHSLMAPASPSPSA